MLRVDDIADLKNAPRELDWLFLDFNSYFASVEQQTRPELRGKPVAVVPVETDSTCAIAASYPAKACGVRTGTPIHEAKKLCPGLICILADHRKYVEYHKRILKEIDRHIPVFKVASIDEMACRLTGRFRQPEQARALALSIKQGIAQNVGEAITCSIGLSTNRYLAKIATDLEKPDGLVTLHAADLPGPLLTLKLRDLPGIGVNMERRLLRAGILTVAQLWNSPPDYLRKIWGSVEGARFWYRLHGVEIPDDPTERGTVGHSHVLSPEFRPASRAWDVARRLTLKAASRLRRYGLRASRLDLGVRVEHGPRLNYGIAIPLCCDNLAFLDALAALWSRLLEETGAQARFKKVSVSLHGLSDTRQEEQLELFQPLPSTGRFAPPRQEQRDARERLSLAMDEIIRRFGRDAITLGHMPGAANTFTGTKVAFNRIPEISDFDDNLPLPQK